MWFNPHCRVDNNLLFASSPGCGNFIISSDSQPDCLRIFAKGMIMLICVSGLIGDAFIPSTPHLRS